jgi:hypothetical protein
VAPFLTSTTLPLSWLRALSLFMGGSWLRLSHDAADHPAGAVKRAYGIYSQI